MAELAVLVQYLEPRLLEVSPVALQKVFKLPTWSYAAGP